MKLWLIPIIALLAVGVVAAIPVTDCGQFNESGVYELQNDVNVTETQVHSYGNDCFDFAAGDVVLDGMGNTVVFAEGTDNNLFAAFTMGAGFTGEVRNVRIIFDSGANFPEAVEGAGSGNVTLRNVTFIAPLPSIAVNMWQNDYLLVEDSSFQDMVGITTDGGGVVEVRDTIFNVSEVPYWQPGNPLNFFYGVSNAVVDGNTYLMFDGSGYSETCPDENQDRICDSPYEPMVGAVDAHPRVYGSRAPSCAPGVPCNPLGTGGSVGGGSAPQQQVVVPQAAIGETMQGTTTFSLGAWLTKAWNWLAFWRK